MGLKFTRCPLVLRGFLDLTVARVSIHEGVPMFYEGWGFDGGEGLNSRGGVPVFHEAFPNWHRRGLSIHEKASCRTRFFQIGTGEGLIS